MFHLSLALYLHLWAEHSFSVKAYFIVLLHGCETALRVQSAGPVELVKNQVLGFQYHWLPEL